MNDRDLQERKVFLAQIEEHFEKKNFRTALELARSRLNRAPGDLDSRIVICRVWMQQGRIDEVREMLSEIEQILASLAQVYACIGNICSKKDLHEAAEFCHEKCRLLNPGSEATLDESMRLMEIESRQNALTAEQEKKKDGAAPADWQSETIDELYIRHGYLPLAEEALKAILHKDSQQEKAVERLVEVREMARQEARAKSSEMIVAELSRWLGNIGRLRGKTEPEATAKSSALVIEELSRWLDNIDRLRNRAEPDRSSRLTSP